MFDATAGRQASTQKIDQLTDRFAAEFEDRMKDLSMSEQETLVEKLVDVVSGLDAARSFATNAAGQPAAALGTGGAQQFDPTQITAQQALTALATHEPRLGPVLQRMALGLQSPNTPGALVVNQNGEFAELDAARREVADKERERADAVRELNEERDANHNGSLAHQLAAAQNAAATPVDAVAKATMLPLVEAVEQAASQLGTHMMTSNIDGIDELNAKVAAAKSAAS